MHSFFFIRVSDKRLDCKYVKIDHRDVVYIEGRVNYVKIVTRRQEWLVLGNMKTIESQLPRQLFCRVHKSWVVALEHIESFDHERVCLKGKQIPIGAMYKTRLMESVVILKSELPPAEARKDVVIEDELARLILRP